MENQKQIGPTSVFFWSALAVFLIIVAGLLFFVLTDGLSIREKKRDTITVSGTGEVCVKPDLAVITFTVQTEAKNVDNALSQNTKRMNAVIIFVKDQGIEDRDLKTTTFGIYPRYEYQERYDYPKKKVLIGYRTTQSLQVKIRDLDKIGQIIEGATVAGANQVGNLQFTVDNQEELKRQARKIAVNKARAKAKELASQLDVNLVKIVGFNESSQGPVRWSADAAMSKGGAAPQIETGESKIRVSVSIVYEID